MHFPPAFVSLVETSLASDFGRSGRLALSSYIREAGRTGAENRCAMQNVFLA